MIPFGSLVTGLGTNASDADLYVRLPNYNSSVDVYVIEETAKLFEKEPTLYAKLWLRPTRIIPLFTFYHIPTQIYCDIVYKSSDGVVNSKIVGYYFNLDRRFQHLGIFLKFWSNIHNVTGHDTEIRFRNYVLYLLIIFYLQQKEMVPSVFELQKDVDDHFDYRWITDFKKIPYTSNNTESLYQLIGGFFKYYSEFNFEEYIVSPFAGRPIHKSKFKDVNSVPEEFFKYKANSIKGNMKPFAYNTDICIQDIIKHNLNMVDMVAQEGVVRFTSHVKSAAKIFKALPSDRFLGAVLDKEHQNKTFVWNPKSIIDQMSELKDCINVSVS